MNEPAWVHPDAVSHIHRQLLEQFGGSTGVRDPGMLDSALARAPNLWHYGDPNIFQMAAAYGFGIAMNHPFVDGNKRTAFVVSALFLELNGYSLSASEVDAAEKFLDLAAGDLQEEELATWFEANSTQL